MSPIRFYPKQTRLYFLGERDNVALIQVSNTFSIDFHDCTTFDRLASWPEISTVGSRLRQMRKMKLLFVNVLDHSPF